MDSEYVLTEKADALAALGRRSEASAVYAAALSRLKSRPPISQDPALAGWCRYKLGDYDLATDQLLRAVSTARVQDGMSHFDLSLAMLSAGLPNRAADGYRTGGYEVAELPDPLRGRGMPRVALQDLRDAHLDIAQSVAIADQLDSALQQSAYGALKDTLAPLIHRVDRSSNLAAPGASHD